ncbi:hypothetical protein PMAYCL1PPCAC_08760, partial [Pristionchus mayeri]
PLGPHSLHPPTPFASPQVQMLYPSAARFSSVASRLSTSFSLSLSSLSFSWSLLLLLQLVTSLQLPSMHSLQYLMTPFSFSQSHVYSPSSARFSSVASRLNQGPPGYGCWQRRYGNNRIFSCSLLHRSLALTAVVAIAGTFRN